MDGEVSLSPRAAPSSSGKHRRSPECAEAASPKRRRHHHHHHRRSSSSHHRHSHHRRHAEKNEMEAAAVASVAAAAAKPVDDEIEEGEILEEDGGGGDGAPMELGRGSDVESGEVQPVSGASVPALEHYDNANKNSDIDESQLHALRLASDSSQKGDCQTKEWKPDCSPRDIDSGALSSGGESIKGDEPSRRMSKSPRSNREKERRHRDVAVHDTVTRGRCASPASAKDPFLVEQRGNDGYHTSFPRNDHAFTGESDENGMYVRRRSVSPGRLKDQSRKSHHREGHSRDRSRSRDKKRETNAQANGSRGSMRDASDHESYERRDRLDIYAIRSRESERAVHKEEERSSSRISHGHVDRNDSRERYRDEKRYRDSTVDRERVDLHEVARRDRERSSSRSRPSRRESAYHSRDEGRERERLSTRDKDRERRRDKSRDRYKETDRVHSGHEGEKLRDDRDRRLYRDKEMDARKDREGRERVSSSDGHRDSLHSKHNALDGHKDRSRFRDKGREADHRSQKSDGVREYSLREEDEEDYLEKVEQQLAKQEEDDPEKIKEEARKRKEAILEKYKQLAKQEEDDPEKIKEEARKRKEAILEKYRQKELQQKQLEALPTSRNKEEAESLVGVENAELKADKFNNSVLDEEVEEKHGSSDVFAAEASFTLGKSPTHGDVSASAGTSGNKRKAVFSGLGEGTPTSERSADMFCDDIFGESPAGVRKLGKEDGLHVEKNALHDNWDDAEGYYTYRFGELLDGRYEITAAHGSGVFSTVIRAKDLKAGKGDPEEVAIKIIRSNETMYKAGKREVSILEKLAIADREDKRHCVRFISSFMYRNHLCLVFESLHMNLREVLKKFGRNIGLRLAAVRAYAKQLFIALKHLKNCKVLHCDIKPDNMLVNEAKNVLKLCDFGNAMYAGKNEITPYLVSRFYRAPEIILGLPYDHPLDMWSVGCCLYEFYTGKVLFPGKTNNDMLRLHMELKGHFPKKMVRKGAFVKEHFDQDLNFQAIEEDPVTKLAVKKLLVNIKPKDVGALISNFPGEDPKMLSSFKDLLERIFVLDPEKRITVSQALSHPFITECVDEAWKR